VRTRIFHPRNDEWAAHFEIGAASEIVGRTAVGRATLDLLQINRPIAMAIRSEERLRSRWP